MRGVYYNTDREKADDAWEQYQQTCAKCIYQENGSCEYGGDYCAFEDTYKMCKECEYSEDCDGIDYMSKDQCEKKRGLQ